MSSRNGFETDAATRVPARAATQHTPGPWAWMGNQHGLYLATTHSGRRYVMGFRRMGMHGAQPVFRIGDRLVPAADLVEFEVGDGAARGFADGKADGSVYRYDVSGIDAADARLIAAAPDLLAALIQMEAEKADYMRINNLGDPALEHTNIAARRAIAKATGQEVTEGRDGRSTGHEGQASTEPLPPTSTTGG